MDEIAQRLAAGPATFPHEIDPVRDMLLLVGLDEQRIAQASFLDQRVLTPQTWGRWLPFAEVETRLDPAGRDDAQYIFHIGHVGSTLISRLLGESPSVLALREPQVLRNLTDIVAKKDAIDVPWNPNWLPARSAMLRRMLARCFRSDQRAIVKATSFTSEIAPLLMDGEARSLLLYTSPWSYLTTILAGEVSRKETSLLAGPRLARLARRIDPMPFRLWSMGEGERIAMSWLTEMLSLRAAADALPNGRALWVDFDQFLAAPIPNLGEIATHLGVSFSARALANLLEGPIMQRYSKAPEHGYSSQLRRQLQQEAAHAHIQTVLDGLRWLEKLADENADVARILAHAGGLGAPA
jgi:hypothetical protein